jgi:hypothetical protein
MLAYDSSDGIAPSIGQFHRQYSQTAMGVQVELMHLSSVAMTEVLMSA